MATSTANTILKSGSSESGPFSELLKITDYPDLGSTPNMLDTTDLSATKYMTSIIGLQEIPDLEFEANYDLETYTTISAMEGEHFFSLEFGEDGINGKFQWGGDIAIYAQGGGVDEVRKMTVIMSASTPIELTA